MYVDSNALLIQKQAEIISKQNAELKSIHEHYQTLNNAILDKLKDEKVYGNFYRQLQKTIMENPTLLEEWQRFCLLLKMTDPDADKYQKISY